MADRGSGCMGQARPNLSNQAYRPDAEPPAAGPGQTGGTPLPGGPTARLCYFLPPTARPFGGTSYQGRSHPCGGDERRGPRRRRPGPMATLWASSYRPDGPSRYPYMVYRVLFP